MQIPTELEKQTKAASRLINLRFIFGYESVRHRAVLGGLPDVKDLLSPVESQEIFKRPVTWLGTWIDVEFSKLDQLDATVKVPQVSMSDEGY